MMKKRIKNTLLIVSLAIVLFGLVAGGTLYYLLFAPQFHPERTVYIYIDRDDTADSIYNKVYREGRANRLAGFRWMAKYKRLDRNVHTGRYVIHPGDDVYHVYSRLSRGYQEPYPLVVGSVRTLGVLARNVGRQLMVDSAEIAARLTDTLYLRRMGYDSASIYTLFLPDTYEVYWDMSADDFFLRMQKERERFWNSDRLEKAASIGMTPEEVCTLASIVEEETNNEEEKPIVAGLYMNRLMANIPLQADPTVRFAMRNFGIRRVMSSDLKIDSPYNTYLRTGLPPGPIRIPTKKGIDSVLNYARHNYLYMCAKEDFSGTHNFASNYADHMANARRYWKALNERKIFR